MTNPEKSTGTADDCEERFERFFEGRWTPRWFNVFADLSALRPPVEITGYDQGNLTEHIIAVRGRDDAGTRIEFTGLTPKSKGLGVGWRRLA